MLNSKDKTQNLSQISKNESVGESQNGWDLSKEQVFLKVEDSI